MRILAAIIFTLLLFGCISNQTGTNQNNSQLPAQNLTPTPPNINGSTANQNKYSGMSFNQLMGLNVPLLCDITYVHLGQSFQSTVYLKGDANIRVESIGGSGLPQCVKTISIVQGNQVFVGCENKSVMPSCDWVESSYNPASMGESATFDFSSTPPSQISCADWSFVASIFATPGNVCQLGN